METAPTREERDVQHPEESRSWVHRVGFMLAVVAFVAAVLMVIASITTL